MSSNWQKAVNILVPLSWFIWLKPGWGRGQPKIVGKGAGRGVPVIHWYVGPGVTVAQFWPL